MTNESLPDYAKVPYSRHYALQRERYEANQDRDNDDGELVVIPHNRVVMQKEE